MASDDRGTVRVSIDVSVDRAAAFASILDELPRALSASGVHLSLGPEGVATQGDAIVGRVTVWQPAERVVVEWRPAPWQSTDATEVELRLERAQSGTRVVLEQRAIGASLGEPSEQLGWFATHVAAPLLAAAAPLAMGDWLTDRRARRPSGAQARDTYGAPLYHYPLFRVILSELRLTPDDHLLEVGCGGGVLLREALRCGCRAAGVDHSPDMVRLARAQNAEAIADRRLQILEATADALPFPAETFTCATMTGVFGFLPDPVAALAELRRVLRPGGRIVVAGADPELRGTPAAPEPMASRLHFYDTAETERIARDAGFSSSSVLRVNLLPHARDVGIPEAHLPLFDGASRFLVASR